MTEASVFLSLGSNVAREQHITAALDVLANEFGELAMSSVYESEAVGFDGEPFLNLVVGIRSALPVAELSALLKQWEADNGRRPDAPRFSPRTLDLDILTVNELVGTFSGVELPRGEILRNAFVLCPLSEIAPNQIHPVAGKSYARLWQEYTQDQRLWPVPFRWQGRQISPRPPRE